MLRERGYEVRLRGTWPPARVTWQGADVPYRADGSAPGWRYDGDRLTTIVSLPRADVATRKELVVEQPAGADDALLDGVPGRLLRLEARDEDAGGALAGGLAVRRVRHAGADRAAPHAAPGLGRGGAARASGSSCPRCCADCPEMKGDTAVIRRALRHLDQ